MIELTAGQETPLTGRIRMGVGWDKERTAGAIGTGAPDIDLDATAVQFVGEQLFDLAFYNNLSTRDGSVVHLGDNLTGAGEGDDEQLTVDLDRVHAPVDTIVLLVSSYQGHTLEWVNRAYCRISDERPTPSSRGSGSPVASPQTGMVLATLKRSPDGWVHAGGRRGRGDHRADAGAGEAAAVLGLIVLSVGVAAARVRDPVSRVKDRLGALAARSRVLTGASRGLLAARSDAGSARAAHARAPPDSREVLLQPTSALLGRDLGQEVRRSAKELAPPASYDG